jgi:FlaA1/EpsC-like NDP-sugar epimerase
MINVLKGRVFLIFKKYSLPRWAVLLVDMAVVYFSFLIAYMLRYNFETYPFEIKTVFRQDYLVLGIYTLFILLFQSYAGMIRHTTLKDAYKIIYSSSCSLLVLALITLLSRNLNWNSIFNIPISILVIHSGAVTLFLLLFRVSVKMFYEFVSVSEHERRNVLIYGSGDVGNLVRKVIEGDPKSQFRLKGFVDDDRKRQGKSIDGYPVFSREVLNREFIENEKIKVLIIAIKNLAPLKKKEVLESLLDLGCEILDTPAFDNWLNGGFEIKNLKKVEFVDLLGREPIVLDLERIKAGLSGKTIMVTGAAGSIGSEISRQLIRFCPKMILMVDQAETPSFYLNEEFKRNNVSCSYRIILGDVSIRDNIEKIFIEYKPDIVFHAAAYKHVPMMESQPHEAFRINVGGTMIMTELALKYSVEKFVMVSSDKAVNPTNVMGATKKICEMLVQAQSKRSNYGTQFITTRFGNVLGSNGSVIPLFNKQIESGGPITITHPEIKRFFMSISEACQLVLEAGFMGNGGQIFVFDMGEPIRIIDIAHKLIRLSGLEPGKDIQIKYTGLRPGEKMYEELFSGAETMMPTHNPKIMIAEPYRLDGDSVQDVIDTTLDSIYKKDGNEIINVLKKLVPEYDTKLGVLST